MYTTALSPYALQTANKSGTSLSVNQFVPVSPASRDKFECQIRFEGNNVYTSHVEGGLWSSWDSTKPNKPSKTQKPPFVSTTHAANVSTGEKKEVLKHGLHYIAEKTAGQNAGNVDISEFTDILNQEFKNKGLKEISPGTVLAIFSDESIQDKAFKGERKKQILAAYKKYTSYRKADPSLGEDSRYQLLALWNQNCKKMGLKEIQRDLFYRLLANAQEKSRGIQSADIQDDTAYSFSHQAEGSNSSHIPEEVTIPPTLSGTPSSVVNPWITPFENGSSSIASMTPLFPPNHWQAIDQPPSLQLDINPFEDVFATSPRHPGHKLHPPKQFSSQEADLRAWANYMAELKCNGNRKDYRKAEAALDEYLREHYKEHPAVLKVQVVTMAEQLLPFAQQQAQLQFIMSQGITPSPMENALGLDLALDSSYMPSPLVTVEQRAHQLHTSQSELQILPDNNPSSCSSATIVNSASELNVPTLGSPFLSSDSSQSKAEHRAGKRPMSSVEHDPSRSMPSEPGNTLTPLDLASMKKFPIPEDPYDGVFVKKMFRTLLKKLGFEDKKPDELIDFYRDSNSIYSHPDEDDAREWNNLLKPPEGASHSQKRYFEGLKKRLPSIILSNKRHRGENN